jgi:hypothetical protein
LRLTALINCTEDHLTLGDCLASVIQQGPTIELIFLACPEGLGAASREFARRACKEHASVTVIEGDKGDAEFKQALLRTGPGFLMIIDGQGVLEAEAARTLLPALLDGPPAVALTSWRWADGAGNPLEGALAGLGSAGVDRELLNNPWVQGPVWTFQGLLVLSDAGNWLCKRRSLGRCRSSSRLCTAGARVGYRRFVLTFVHRAEATRFGDGPWNDAVWCVKLAPLWIILLRQRPRLHLRSSLAIPISIESWPEPALLCCWVRARCAS